MSETLVVAGVCFTFCAGPKGAGTEVEITIGNEHRRMPLTQFVREMLPVSEEAMLRAGYTCHFQELRCEEKPN